MPLPSRYDEGARKLIAEVGLNKEISTTAGELAELIGMPTSVVSRVLTVMQRVGTAHRRDEWFGKGGRKVYYTLTGDFAETERRMKAQGIPWSAFVEEKQGGVIGPAKSLKPPRPVVGPVKSLAELSPLRKSEPRAELEIARKYRDQQAFVATKRAEFEAMGLVMPEPSPLYDSDRRRELDAIVRILPYVESIEKANANLEEQNRTVRAPLAELSQLRTDNARQRDQIERLVREKGQIKDDVQRVLEDHKREVQNYKGQIDQLEGQLRQLRGDRAVRSAIQTVAAAKG